MAFFSDIHGNLRALDAVLEELSRRAIKDIYVAGDLLLGGEQPVEVFKRLSQIGAKVGDVVKAGALLGVLDSSEASAQLKAAQAQVRAAEAQLALAEDTERRTTSMVQSGAFAEAAGVQSAQSKALAQASSLSSRYISQA